MVGLRGLTGFLPSLRKHIQDRKLRFYLAPDDGSQAMPGNGNLFSFTDLVNGQWTAQYDTLNRLKSATLAGTPSTIYAWTYDPFGNRMSQSPNGGVVNYPLPTNRSSNWAYDASGNVTDDGINEYAYDGEGRLCMVYNKTMLSYTGYAYDGVGNRVARDAGESGGLQQQLVANPDICGREQRGTAGHAERNRRSVKQCVCQRTVAGHVSVCRISLELCIE